MDDNRDKEHDKEDGVPDTSHALVVSTGSPVDLVGIVEVAARGGSTRRLDSTGSRAGGWQITRILATVGHILMCDVAGSGDTSTTHVDDFLSNTTTQIDVEERSTLPGSRESGVKKSIVIKSAAFAAFFVTKRSEGLASAHAECGVSSAILRQSTIAVALTLNTVVSEGSSPSDLTTVGLIILRAFEAEAARISSSLVASNRSTSEEKSSNQEGVHL